MTRPCRIEGVVLTRWNADRSSAIDAYNRSRACRHLPIIHGPGEVAGDVFDGGAGHGTAAAVHGVRDGHATVTLRYRKEQTDQRA